MGDGTYITVADVRRSVGIDSTAISDNDVGDLIAECEPQIERFFNTSFTPKQRIETLDGNGTIRIFTDKNPLLAVRFLEIDGDEIDLDDFHVYKGSGKIELDTTATTTTFKNKSKSIIIKYLYGMLEESSTTTTTTAASTAGTSVALTVSAITGFADTNWVEIYGTDGNREVAQVNATPSGSTVQVDQLVLTHASGSTLVKLQASLIIEKLMIIVTAIAMVARIVGESYTDIVGYTISEFSTQKGEPYTQWRETATQLIRERDRLIGTAKAQGMLKPRFCIR